MSEEIPSDFIDLRPDSKLQKHIFVNSTEVKDIYPKDGDMAEILYKCRKSDYTVIDSN